MRHTVEPDCVRAFHALELDGLGALDRSSGPRPSALQSPVGDSQSHLRLRHHHLPQPPSTWSANLCGNCRTGKDWNIGKVTILAEALLQFEHQCYSLVIDSEKVLGLEKKHNWEQWSSDGGTLLTFLTPLFELMSECNFAAREGFLIFANLPKSFAKLPKRRGRGGCKTATSQTTEVKTVCIEFVIGHSQQTTELSYEIPLSWWKTAEFGPVVIICDMFGCKIGRQTVFAEIKNSTAKWQNDRATKKNAQH